jgi:hypothetical protein
MLEGDRWPSLFTVTALREWGEPHLHGTPYGETTGVQSQAQTAL